MSATNRELRPPAPALLIAATLAAMTLVTFTACHTTPERQTDSPRPTPAPQPAPQPTAHPAPPTAPDDVQLPPLPADAPSEATPSITIDLDYSGAPDLKDWAENVRTICEDWYPRICRELASDGFTPPTHTTIVIDENIRGVAATSGGRIRASAKYIRAHKDDLGMMVHELVHVVQSYPNRPRRAPGWVVEGIADYIRFYKYEPGADRSRIDPEKATYHDSYRTTAAFFDYVVRTHDPDVIRKLNGALRAGECDEEKAKDLLGGNPDALWKDFLKERESN